MPFHFKSLELLRSYCIERGYDIPFSDDISVLAQSLDIGGKTVNNRFCVHPMEGCDALPDGSPSEKTTRRCLDFARGGSGVIWLEAIAVAQEGRSSPAQLMLTENNAAAFSRLVDMIRQTAKETNGFEPFIVAQLTHSGRFSKPESVPRPLIAYHRPDLDAVHAVDPNLEPVTDAYLDTMPERFARSAVLAAACGFDAADIKCCHRYLLSELLSAFERPGKYGGSFENRSRLLLDCMKAARASAPRGFLIASRLNIYDALPGGFCCPADGDYMRPCLDEAFQLVELMNQNGLCLLNVTAGSPYYNAYVNRPNDADKTEEPLAGVARMFGLAAEISRRFPSLPVAGTSFSYLREYMPQAAAAQISAGNCTFAGLGRQSLACPDFPRLVLRGETVARNRLCTTCGRCAMKLRAGEAVYCDVRHH